MYNKSKKEFFTMKNKIFKVLYCLLFDGFFLYILGAYWNESGWYNLLFIAFIALFTWGLINAFKDLSK
jgi:hypothetical protein